MSEEIHFLSVLSAERKELLGMYLKLSQSFKKFLSIPNTLQICTTFPGVSGNGDGGPINSLRKIRRDFLPKTRCR